MRIPMLFKARDAASPRGFRVGLAVPSLGPGGLEEAVALLAVTLPSFGIEVSVLCTDAGGPIADRLANAGVPVHLGGGSTRKWRAWVKDFAPDVVSTHFAQTKAVEVFAAIAPVVETVQNTYVWFSLADWAAERAKCAMVSSLIAVSDIVAAYHRRALDSDARVSVIPNGVSPGRFAEVAQPAARERLGLERDDAVLVNVGRFCLQKNQVGLVEALADVLAEHPRLRLLLVGGQEDRRYADSVTKSAGAHLARGAVRMLPHTDDVGLALAAADAFISNSFFEGWSLAATEALWMGRPTILSETGGARELVGDNGSRGLLVPNPAGDPMTLELDRVRNPDADATRRNRDAVQHAVRSFLADRRMWSDRSTAIARVARERWSAERMASAYAAVFRAAARAGA